MVSDRCNRHFSPSFCTGVHNTDSCKSISSGKKQVRNYNNAYDNYYGEPKRVQHAERFASRCHRGNHSQRLPLSATATVHRYSTTTLQVQTVKGPVQVVCHGWPLSRMLPQREAVVHTTVSPFYPPVREYNRWSQDIFLKTWRTSRFRSYFKRFSNFGPAVVAYAAANLQHLAWFRNATT